MNLRRGIIICLGTIGTMLVSCGGGDTKGPELEDDSIAVLSDSVLALMAYNDSMRTSLYARVEISGRSQLAIDSLYLDTLADGPSEFSLTGDDVRFLSKPMVEGRLTDWYEFYVTEFLLFDSLAENDLLEAHTENLDLGQTAHCDGMVLELFSPNDSTDLLIWLIDYHTYEACPYGWGTTCFVSLFVKGDFINSAVAGTFNGGADPPVWGDDLIVSEWMNGKLMLTETNRSCDGETDEEMNEIVTTEVLKHELSIVNGVLKMTKTE